MSERDDGIGAIRAEIAERAAAARARPLSLAEARAQVEAMTAKIPLPEGVRVAQGDLGGVACEMVTPASARPGRTILYLHGGGYATGAARTHRGRSAQVALSAGAEVAALDYRLAPEHPFPAAVDDVLAGYRALLAAGRPPGQVLVAGDSAGGGPALALAIGLEAAGLP